MSVDPAAVAAAQPRGWRNELKVWITPHQRAALRPLLEQMLEPDPRGDGHGRYQVTSLYLDSPDFRLFRETFDGQGERAKYRVRYYGDDDRHLALEVKEKVGSLVRKARGWIQLERLTELEALIRSAASPLPETFAIGCARGLYPRLWVRYQRTAMIGVHDQLRVTIDEQVAAAPACGYRPPRAFHDVQLSRWQPRLILELKFGRVAPTWLVRELQRQHLAPRPISKYELGLARAFLHRADMTAWTL